MHDVMRKRILRKLEVLPESQLYQVLDYIEFLEGRYANAPAPSATGFQRFAERLEDQMRLRSLAAHTMNGTMKVVSVAGKVIDGISSVFEPLPDGANRPRPPEPRTPAIEPLEGPRAPLPLPRASDGATSGRSPREVGGRGTGGRVAEPPDRGGDPGRSAGAGREPGSGPEPA